MPGCSHPVMAPDSPIPMRVPFDLADMLYVERRSADDVLAAAGGATKLGWVFNGFLLDQIVEQSLAGGEAFICDEPVEAALIVGMYRSIGLRPLLAVDEATGEWIAFIPPTPEPLPPVAPGVLLAIEEVLAFCDEHDVSEHQIPFTDEDGNPIRSVAVTDTSGELLVVGAAHLGCGAAVAFAVDHNTGEYLLLSTLEGIAEQEQPYVEIVLRRDLISMLWGDHIGIADELGYGSRLVGFDGNQIDLAKHLSGTLVTGFGSDTEAFLWAIGELVEGHQVEAAVTDSDTGAWGVITSRTPDVFATA